jgi:glycerol-3-phosphate dehydrogenase (NAD(P)+)
VTTAPALVARAASLGVDLPICAAVADLVGGKLSVRDAVARLLARPQRDE